MIYDLMNRAKGSVELFHSHPGDREEILARQDNLILFSGADLLAKALSGPLAVNAVYMEYTNGVVPSPSIDRSRGRDYYEGLSGDQGYMRISLVSSPLYLATGSDYDGNKVTFTAVSDGSKVVGPAITDGLTKVYAAALVASGPVFSDRTADTLFSALNYAAYVPKLANVQIGIRWSIQFS